MSPKIRSPGNAPCLVEVLAADVEAAALHVVAGEPGAAGVGGEVGAGQGRVEQADQVAERFFLARVRGSGDEQQVPAAVSLAMRVSSS